MNTNYELRDYVDYIDVPHPFEGQLNERRARALIHGYYACISYMDTQVGRLIAALDEQGLSDNTIIVVWSDHGWKLGDYRGWGKMTNYELDTRSPMMIIDPRLKTQAGSHRKQLVESLDLFPTLCELADISKPKQLDGISLLPLLKNADLPSRKAAYSQFFSGRYNKSGPQKGLMGHAVRTDKFRYIAWRDFKTHKLEHEELYELDKTDYETKNVAGHPPSKAILKDMQKLETRYWPINK